LNTINKLKN